MGLESWRRSFVRQQVLLDHLEKRRLFGLPARVGVPGRGPCACGCLHNGGLTASDRLLLPRLPVPLEHVEPVILFLREQKVLLDSDLAALYGVPVKALNQAVKRNLARLPEDFMFQLTLEEARRSRSQSVTLKSLD